MHHLRKIAVLLTLFPAVALAQNGIRNTRHDLSSSGTAGLSGANLRSTENQICKFCHTPHKSQSTQLVWNRALATATGWTWGDDLDGTALTATRQGTTLPGTIRSASRRCLTCHDGTTVVGQVSNAGGGASGTIAGSTGTVGANYNLTGGTQNMGTNHPISIQYAGQTYNTWTSGVPAADIGAAIIGGYFTVQVGGTCISTTGTCTVAPSTDGRNGLAINLIGDGTGWGVECTSCHEPHNKYGPNPYFTRVDVSNASGLCRSCHNK